MPVLSFTLTHPHCRQLPPDKGLPWPADLSLETLHIFMASGGSIQPKMSVYQCRGCTFKILLILSKTFGIFKGKWHEANRELAVPCLCFSKSPMHLGQAGTKLLTPSWVLMQGLNPAQRQTDFHSKWQSSQAGTGFETKTSHPRTQTQLRRSHQYSPWHLTRVSSGMQKCPSAVPLRCPVALRGCVLAAECIPRSLNRLV